MEQRTGRTVGVDDITLRRTPANLPSKAVKMIQVMEQERRQLVSVDIGHSITGSFRKFLLTLKQITKVCFNSQNGFKSDLRS
jgi:hypothetical protein